MTGARSAVTTSAGETRSLAAAVASLAEPGDVVLLEGDLGAGKTTFAQGFAQALGVAGPVTSPTFILIRTYPARIPLAHADLYRLDDLAEVADLGLRELLDDGAVALIEWGDVAASLFAPDYLEVRMDLRELEEERRFDVTPSGSSWQLRSGRLQEALAPWDLSNAGPT